MRTDQVRRLKALESSSQRRHEASIAPEWIDWLDATYGAQVGWVLADRLTEAAFTERVGLIVDFLEAAEAHDPAASAKFYEHASRTA